MINGSLEITTMIPCINHCKFCPQDKLKENYRNTIDKLSIFYFMRILNKVPKNVRIDFSGFSEPFGNPETSSMMFYAHHQGYKLTLYTTLIGLRNNDLEFINDIPFLDCVIHAPDNFNFVISEDIWIENYLKFKDVVKVTNVYYHIGQLSEKVSKIIPDARQVSTLSRANNVNPEVYPNVEKQSGTVGCWVSNNQFNQNILLPNGDVYLCCMDWSLKYKFGNLFEQSYESLFHGDIYKKIITECFDEKSELICRYCRR